MESNGMDQNGNNSDDMSFEPSVSLNSYTTGVYGDPEILPRVGNQYQVEIQPLISESEYVPYTKNPLEEENKGGPFDFLMGLPISIIWVNPEVKPIKDEKVEFLSDLKHPSKRRRRSEDNVESFEVGLKIENTETDELEEKRDMIKGFLVPGSYGESWSDVEKARFLLGLYIFHKNFVRVKKFVETKKMGEILLFYYTKFYQTAEYRRWAGCRKGKMRKCALGQRLFSGLRQQELLSRLIRGVSEELQNDLIQVSRSFRDGKILLEEYISSLKNMVGMDRLIDAIGIGRGKQDLSGPSIEPSKANQSILIRPEVPIGKACSSLTRCEILEFLTGDYRLSKARSSDLFWEAVWPILVDKGWDAIQSSSYIYAANSKHSHVFFAPGVKKSSRRGLIKGEQYFDSVTDVLNKIASNPGILDKKEDEDEGTEEMKVEEDGNNDDLPERRRHSYLQPRTPSRSNDVMAFTVVDTSLSSVKKYELRDLRDLPVEVSRTFASRSQSGEDSPEVSTDESDCAAYPMSVDQDNGNVKRLARARSENGTFTKRKNLEAETSSDHGIGSHAGKAIKKPRKDHNAPVGKRRRRLSACHKSVVNLTRPSSDTPEISENLRSHEATEGSSHVKLSATSSSRASSNESFEERVQDNKPNDRPLFDLNYPADFDFGSNAFAPEMANTQNAPSEQIEPMAGPEEEEQVNLNSRRQSSRNRPPTARALEAFAHGFLSVTKRGRGETSRSRSKKSQHYQEEARGSGLGTSDNAKGTNSGVRSQHSQEEARGSGLSTSNIANGTNSGVRSQHSQEEAANGANSDIRSQHSQEEARGSGLGTSDTANGTTDSNISGNGEIWANSENCLL